MLSRLGSQDREQIFQDAFRFSQDCLNLSFVANFNIHLLSTRCYKTTMSDVLFPNSSPKLAIFSGGAA